MLVLNISLLILSLLSAFLERLLLCKALDLKYADLALGMAANHEDILVFVDSFHVDTSDTVAFERLVHERLNFLLCGVVQSSGAVGATDANVFF